MNNDSLAIVQKFGTTDKIFLKEETTRMSEQQVDAFFTECMDTLFKLCRLKNNMISETRYVQDHPDEHFGPGEYLIFQVAGIESFVVNTLSVEFMAFEETQVSTKPICSERLHTFTELYRVLWDKCDEIATNYFMEDSDADTVRGLVTGCIYHLTVFVIIQFNLECSVLDWEESNELHKEICSTVTRYCDKTGEELADLLAVIRVSYDTTKPVLPALEGQPSKTKQFIDLIGYTFFDLAFVPEMVTTKTVSDIVAGRVSVEDYNGEVFNAINKKFGSN